MAAHLSLPRPYRPTTAPLSRRILQRLRHDQHRVLCDLNVSVHPFRVPQIEPIIRPEPQTAGIDNDGGLFSTWRYKFASPAAALRISRCVPVSASYQRLRLFWNPVSRSKGRAVKPNKPTVGSVCPVTRRTRRKPRGWRCPGDAGFIVEGRQVADRVKCRSRSRESRWSRRTGSARRRGSGRRRGPRGSGW